jgi:hypothetical protein
MFCSEKSIAQAMLKVDIMPIKGLILVKRAGDICGFGATNAPFFGNGISSLRFI